MKDYPSIPRSSGQSFQEIPDASVFDKLDGSSCRSEWNRKRLWYKHGRRRGLMDDSNPHLVVVPKLFEETLAEPLTKIARDAKLENMVVFYEFWGLKSIAGLHVEGDPKFLTLFDSTVDKKVFLDPGAFRRTFEDKVPTARAKAKTQSWIDRVIEIHGLDAGTKLVES